MKMMKQAAWLSLGILLAACGGSSKQQANVAPNVEAGISQTVSVAATVTLSGSGSDTDGAIVSWAWLQLSGTTVALGDATQSITTFTAPDVAVSEVLTFRLTVTDNDGATGSDEVNVTVTPVVNAVWPAFGPDTRQCPVTSADLGAGVIHVCDCQSGADAACVPGDDANPGTAAASRQSLPAAMAAFNAGSDVAFCRGGSWQSANSFYPNLSSCSTASPCVIGDYGDSALPKPLIGITDPFNAGINIDPASDTTHWAGLQINNLHLRKTNTPDQGSGIFIFRDINDVAMNCLEIEGFGIGVYIHNDGFATTNVSLRDSQIHDNGVFGWLGSANAAVLERNLFSNNGYVGAGAFQHNLYFSGASSDSVIRGNHLTGSALDETGRCLGASLIVHSGQTTNLLIENNLIEEHNASGGCWGLNVDGVGNGEIHTNAIIRGNIVRDVGNQAIGISSCVDCIVENNIVIQTKMGGAVGIAVPNRPTSAPDADNTGTIVRNNTVYFADAGSGIAYYVGERGSDYVVTNNIGYHGNAVLANSDSCFNFDLPAGDYRYVSNNLCYGAPFAIGTTGLDPEGLEADPQFQNAPLDLRPQPTSPAMDSGSAVLASPTDILGNARNLKPDRGAYEVQ